MLSFLMNGGPTMYAAGRTGFLFTEAISTAREVWFVLLDMPVRQSSVNQMMAVGRHLTLKRGRECGYWCLESGRVAGSGGYNRHTGQMRDGYKAGLELTITSPPTPTPYPNPHSPDQMGLVHSYAFVYSRN